MKCNLGEVIEKAPKTRLPRLVRTSADKRILFFERQHMNLLPENILDEIKKRKLAFPELASVDEIWIIETMFTLTSSMDALKYHHAISRASSMPATERSKSASLINSTKVGYGRWSIGLRVPVRILASYEHPSWCARA